LYPFLKGDKFGFIDHHGRIVIEPKLPLSGEFHNGLLEIGASNGEYVNTSGEIVIPHKFYRGWKFSEGLAVAASKDGGPWGYINTKGEFAISPRFKWARNNYVWPFSDGMAAIQVDGLFGYIDKTGEFVIKPRFPHGGAFYEGMAQVVVEGPCIYMSDGPCGSAQQVPEGTGSRSSGSCKYTFVNRDGNVLAQRFDWTRDFSEGVAPVKVATMWGYIDKSGEFVVQPKFDEAKPFSEGMASVRQNGKWGFIDRTGLSVIQPRFTWTSKFSEGLAVVRTDTGSYVFIDNTGTRAIKQEFDFAGDFYHGLANVVLDAGRWAYVNRTGKHVFTYTR